MPEDFSRKQNHRGSARQIFFTIVVEKPLKKCTHVYAFIPPFTAKRGHFRQSCQGKSCMKFSWHVFEMNIVIKERKEGRKRRKEGKGGGRRKRRKKEKGRKGKKWVVFVFLRHFIYFQTRIGIFAGHRGSAGQIFFTLVDEKPLKKVVIYMPAYVPFTAKTDRFRQSW